MIGRFKNFNVSNLVILVIFAFLMRISVFSIPPSNLQVTLFESFAKFNVKLEIINQVSSEFNLILAFIVTLGQALLINQIINNHILFGKPNLIPALSYVVVSSLFPQFLVFSSPLVCNFLLIWMFDKVVRMSKTGNSLAMMFDMGLIVAVGTLLYFPFITMFLVILIGLMLFRPFYWREWFSGLFGFATVYLFIAVYYFWYGNFDQFYQIFKPFTYKFPNKVTVQWNDFFPLIPLIVILALSFWKLRQNFYNSFVAIRKTYQWLFVTFLVASVSFYLKPSFSIVHFTLCVPTIAIFVGYYFNNATKKWVYESLFWVFVIVIQYFQWV